VRHRVPSHFNWPLLRGAMRLLNPVLMLHGYRQEVAGQASNITWDFVKRTEDWNGNRPMSKFIPTVTFFKHFIVTPSVFQYSR